MALSLKTFVMLWSLSSWLLASQTCLGLHFFSYWSLLVWIDYILHLMPVLHKEGNSVHVMILTLNTKGVDIHETWDTRCLCCWNFSFSPKAHIFWMFRFWDETGSTFSVVVSLVAKQGHRGKTCVWYDVERKQSKLGGDELVAELENSWTILHYPYSCSMV